MTVRKIRVYTCGRDVCAAYDAWVTSATRRSVPSWVISRVSFSEVSRKSPDWGVTSVKWGDVAETVGCKGLARRRWCIRGHTHTHTNRVPSTSLYTRPNALSVYSAHGWRCGRYGHAREKLGANVTSLALGMVPSVFDVIAFGLESDVLPSDTVAVAADVAHHVSILTCTAMKLNAGNTVVQEDLLCTNLRAPSALAVVRPCVLACVFVLARL